MKEQKSRANALAEQSTIAIGAAAVGSLVTAALSGPLPPWALAVTGVGGVVFALFVLVLIGRFLLALLLPRWRRWRTGAEIRGDVDAVVAALLEATSPSFVKSVSNIFHQLFQSGFLDANTASAFNAQVMTLSRWTQVTRDQLAQGVLTPLAAFHVLSDPIGSYVDLCNTVSRLVEARKTSDASREGGHPGLKRDWHGIAVFANDLVGQYRLVARRVNARLASNLTRVYFDSVADWP